MIEVWRPCTGFATRYEVSNFGEVRSVVRYANNGHNNGMRRLSGKKLQPCLSSSGYLIVSFSVNNKKSSQNVHRLVAEAFIDNACALPQVNHINGDKTDNRVENLEWVSVSENSKHAYQVLMRSHYLKTDKPVAWITDGVSTRRMLGDFHMPLGWRRGRIYGSRNKTANRLAALEAA